MDLALVSEDAEPFRLTVDQYHDLMEQGVIEEGARVELIEGLIVRMSPQASSHTLVTFRLAMRLEERLRAIGSDLLATTTPTVAIPSHNALEPDVGVLTPTTIGPNFFPITCARLLVEVSRTSLRKDTRLKRDIYAAAGVPEYWVVDVNTQEVHRFADPHDGAYRTEPPPIPLAGELRSLTMAELAIDGSGIL